MAWSDEARRAAAEARRLHAHAKNEIYGNHKAFQEARNAFSFSSSHRKLLAGQLKSIRSGGGGSLKDHNAVYAPKYYMKQAVRSTISRNRTRTRGK